MTGSWLRQATAPSTATGTAWLPCLTSPRPPITPCCRRGSTRSTPDLCQWSAVSPARCPQYLCYIGTRRAAPCSRTTRTCLWTSAAVSELALEALSWWWCRSLTDVHESSTATSCEWSGPDVLPGGHTDTSRVWLSSQLKISISSTPTRAPNLTSASDGAASLTSAASVCSSPSANTPSITLGFQPWTSWLTVCQVKVHVIFIIIVK